MDINLFPNAIEETLEEALGKSKIPPVADEENNNKIVDTPRPVIQEEEEEEEVIVPDEENEPVADDANKVWAEFAREKGFIEFKDEEYDPTDTEFLTKKLEERDQRNLEVAITEYKEQLPKPIKELLDKYEENVPLMELIESRSRSQEYKNITAEDLEDENVQNQILSVFFDSQELSAEEQRERKEKYEATGLKEEEARFALKSLVKMEAKYEEALTNQARVDAERNRVRVEENLKLFEKSIMDKKEIFAGIPLTDDHKKRLITTITKPIGTKDGVPYNKLNKMQMDDPDFLLKLAYVADILNWDLKPLERKATTAATKQIKQTVKAYTDDKTDAKLARSIAVARKALKAFKQDNTF